MAILLSLLISLIIITFGRTHPDLPLALLHAAVLETIITQCQLPLCSFIISPRA
ncbi:hypothetical protein PF005_g15835 [Phytophthora fragariae]|uniref:Uncharacterized protein n=2 Tax=Phytophthora TaxID=4783 RepID=A0A6A3EH40_9STRA|nr:hypothetical protein PF003_g33961 [Phytophthora fragariae]KAE9043775.1 hypothetical protein PR002_g3150 [Phytophthora rubi]KAE8932994.1 hypothetical protein PF009_g16992 [Phytophthora fragariae]KAE8998684.1 hypothetical protein PF011_g14950 [Phytophthora fragariae]KAE9049600.1 hypothetical protein PR001_g3164 [Phytophthora rubi]